jgi:serine/threonine-protein kinase
VTLGAGTKLGPYEIAGALGAGGMGEVYRARDTRVDRPVALKVLPEEFFESEERRGRFEREARMLASLSHPGIATLYSFEEIPSSSSTRHLLVMELVEGEGLDQKISSGSLSLEESLSLARQIAEALEAAHEKGIVHRDLKPANVKVTPEGRVKLLDFGLAKIFEADSASGPVPSVTHSPTLTARGTAAGVILGTAAYMSPEQARGKSVDKRTDVWAFGCVLYEMLTGKRAFEGETVTDVLAAILTKEPDWAALPRQTPGRIKELLRRCLRREAKQRLHDVADARLDLEEAETSPRSAAGQSSFEENLQTEASSKTTGRRRGLLSPYLPWALAAAFAAAAAALALRARAPERAHALQAQIVLSTDDLMDGAGAAVVVSPDGSQVAYATRGPRARLYLRRLDRLVATEVPESDGALSPFFSPDGKWIGFFARGKLRKAPVSGGAPSTICDAPLPRGGTWIPGDAIVFAPQTTGGLSIVPASGGDPRPLTKANVAARERSHRWPAALPGGKAVLFATQLSGSDYDEGIVETVEIATGTRSVVHKGGAFPRWAPSGHVLFARKGTVYALPFDARRLVAAGRPVPVLEKVMSSTGGEAPSDGSAQLDVSTSGFCAYRTGENETVYRLAIVDRTGAVLKRAGAPRGFSWARFAPDGNRIAVVVSTGMQSDVWIYDVARDTFAKLTFEGDDQTIVWGPDGRDVAYTSDRSLGLVTSPGGSPSTIRGVYLKRADGSGMPRLLFKMPGTLGVTGFSRDGRVLAFQVTTAVSQLDVGLIRLRDGQAEGEPTIVVAGPANEGGASFSPDGRWLAYDATDGGLGHVFLRSAAGGDAQWQVSEQMASNPRWARDGKLYFLRQDGWIVETGVTAEGGAPVLGKEEALFRLEAYDLGTRITNGWDVSPDGQRFVVMLREGTANSLEANHVTLVSNFAEGLGGPEASSNAR